jgi:K+-transporting ATPase ATPase C chain
MKLLFRAILLFGVMTLICGILYPLLITGIGQMVFKDLSTGSLTKAGNKIIGSKLIAQGFIDPKYFWPRPSASAFNALPSAASNLSPTSIRLAKNREERRTFQTNANRLNDNKIPPDLLCTSASGLDPHISIDAAKIQIPRIIKARNLKEDATDKLMQLLLHHADKFALSNDMLVNVLMLNLELDQTAHEQ